ncbi:MAG: hypothetical protein ACK51O_09785 [Armatimonadota bacterium]|jgi:hypothetical protein
MTSKHPNRSGLVGFALLVAALTLVRIGYGVRTVPQSAVVPLQILSAIIFIVGPIYAIKAGSSHAWKPAHAWAIFLLGVGIHAGCGVSLARFLPEFGLGTVIVQSLGQAGLLAWCLGLGAIVAGLLKDKNLMLPVAFFLAGFDMFLVFNPTAITAQIVTSRPQVFQSVAATIPNAVSERVSEGMSVVPMAFVGPADLFISAVFFVCLYRFGMRTKETGRWLAVALVGYLILVLAPLGLNMLPALVPIGATVLIVNWREWKLNAEEKQATIGVACIALALASYGLYRRLNTPPVAPGPSSDVPVTSESAPTPAPVP